MRFLPLVAAPPQIAAHDRPLSNAQLVLASGIRPLIAGELSYPAWLRCAVCVGRDDDVVELFPDSVTAARWMLRMQARSYVAVTADSSVAYALKKKLPRDSSVDAVSSGLASIPIPDRHASIVSGNGVTTFLANAGSEISILHELSRLLRARGRLALQELMLGDEVAGHLAGEIEDALLHEAGVRARIRRIQDWDQEFRRAGFEMRRVSSAPIRPWNRLRSFDEPLALWDQIWSTVLDPTGARRLMNVAKVIKRYVPHIRSVAVVAYKK